MCIYELELVCKVKRCINQHHYCEILEQNVCKTIQKFHLNPFHIIFQQNNAPIYKKKLLQE